MVAASMKNSPSFSDVDAFLASERAFFRPALARQATTTDEMKVGWRAETVFDRRLRISREVYDICGGTVRYGRFKGMTLDSHAWWGQLNLGSMMLGVYEKEVQEALFDPRFDDRDVFVCLGAADGYYPIGLCLAGRARKSYAFELSEAGQDVIASNARKNDVADRIEIFGDAGSDLLENLSGVDFRNAIVLVDIEGAEFSVFNENTLQELSKCVFIIEVHNWIENFIEKYTGFIQTVSCYFEISIIEPVEKDILSFRELDEFTDDNRYLLCSEGRPNKMRFLRLIPKSI